MPVVMMLVVMAMAQIVTLMIMIVVMRVSRDHSRLLRAEQFCKFGIVLYRLGPAFAAHMAVEADDTVAFRHDHMQIMAHHQDAAAMLAPDLGNEFIELAFADEIDRLHRLRPAP